MSTPKLVSFFGERSDLFAELNEKTAAYAKQKGIAFEWAPQTPYSVDDVVKHLNEADAGLIDVEPYGEDIFSRLNGRCRLLIRFGVGFDKVDLPAATKHGLCVTRTTGANKTGVAEMALMQILAARRQLMQNRKTIASGVWVKNVGNELIGARVGILGFGNIGAELTKLLAGFGCEVLAYDTYHDEARAKELHVRFADLDEIFTTCDAISVHLPYNTQTHHIIDAAMLAKMKKTAVIVCTARGNIIDEDALYDALSEHRIAGAGLDVYAKEPLPVDSKLIGLDNIILTPHVSSQTCESLWYTYQKAVDIMADFFAGKELGRGDLLNPDYRNFVR